MFLARAKEVTNRRKTGLWPFFGVTLLPTPAPLDAIGHLQ